MGLTSLGTEWGTSVLLNTEKLPASLPQHGHNSLCWLCSLKTEEPAVPSEWREEKRAVNALEAKPSRGSDEQGNQAVGGSGHVSA